jgi:hypothetical protein
MSTEAISLTESKRLIHLEKIIKAGEQTFIEVGNALLEIRDAKLYRVDFSTFEEYCTEKWGWSSRRGNQYIQAANVLNSLPETMRTYVPNETATRPLSKVPPPKRAKIIQKVIDSGQPVTAASIKKAATPPPRKPVAAVPPPKKTPDAKVEVHVERDETDTPIPDALLGLWQRSHEVQETLNFLARIKSVITKAKESDDQLFRALNFQIALEGLEKLTGELKAIKPYAVCPDCRGKATDTCTFCKHTGLIGKFAWDHQTDVDKKAIISKANKK